MDITDQILREITPNPLYHPLSPTVDSLTEYFDDLEHEGNQITIEWATREMQDHQMGWVRVGLVADRVRRYRLYKDKYPDWRTFCRTILGKENWQINKIIKCAKAVMSLVQDGFEILPTCLSQTEKLLTCCQKSGNLLTKSWSIVVKRLHEPSLITARSICEVLGFPMDHGNKISRNQRLKIQDLAARDGMTFDEKLEELIALDTEPDYDSDDEELGITNSDRPEEHPDNPDWQADMKQLVEEHDRQLWFLGLITKLSNWQPPNVSQFGWLKQARCQM